MIIIILNKTFFTIFGAVKNIAIMNKLTKSRYKENSFNSLKYSINAVLECKFSTYSEENLLNINSQAFKITTADTCVFVCVRG